MLCSRVPKSGTKHTLQRASALSGWLALRYGHKRSQSGEQRLLARATRRRRAAQPQGPCAVDVQRRREGRGRCVRRVTGRWADDGGEGARRLARGGRRSRRAWDCPAIAESPSLSAASVAFMPSASGGRSRRWSIAFMPSASRGRSRRWSAGAARKRRRLSGGVP